MTTLAEVDGKVSGLRAQVDALAESVETTRQEQREVLHEIRDQVRTINGRLSHAETSVASLSEAWVEAKEEHKSLWGEINKLRVTVAVAKARMGIWGTLAIPPTTALLTWALVEWVKG